MGLDVTEISLHIGSKAAYDSEIALDLLSSWCPCHLTEESIMLLGIGTATHGGLTTDNNDAGA